jgi:hypothetical protein
MSTLNGASIVPWDSRHPHNTLIDHISLPPPSKGWIYRILYELREVARGCFGLEDLLTRPVLPLSTLQILRHLSTFKQSLTTVLQPSIRAQEHTWWHRDTVTAEQGCWFISSQAKSMASLLLLLLLLLLFCVPSLVWGLFRTVCAHMPLLVCKETARLIENCVKWLKHFFVYSLTHSWKSLYFSQVC